jgi:hypothetical protein
MLDGNDLLLQQLIDSESSEIGAHEGLESITERGRGSANQYAHSQRQDTSYKLG